MSELRKRYCVFGCDSLVTLLVPLHRFPRPDKCRDLFNAWVSVVGEKMVETDPKKIYNNKRVCDHHFDDKDKMETGSHLKPLAVPSVNLNRVHQSATTFVEMDHSYSHPNKRNVRSVLSDITNLPGPSVAAMEIPVPSGSTAATCVTVSDMSQARLPHRKFDADKTFEFLENKANAVCGKKLRQKENEIRRLRRKVNSFKLRLKQMTRNSARVQFQKLTENMFESAKLFTRMQFMEGQKKKQGRIFTMEEKILCLSLYKKSPKSYKLISKHFTVPSRKVLKTLLSQVKVQPGINPIIFEQLKNTVMKLPQQDRLCTLIFDEMSISPQILYNTQADDLVGFEDFGDEKSIQFANHVLVFMVKGVKKNFKQPVAYYFVQNLQTQKLKKMLKDVIVNVQATGLDIVATVCDQGSANNSVINNLISDAKAEYLRLGKEWRKDVLWINNKEIIPLFDVPHLIKGIRNNLLNKYIYYSYDHQNKIVKWDYFMCIFEADKTHGELRMLPKLTTEHIYPEKIKKMRVKNATQVLSHSMAVAADNLVARGEVPSECRDLIPFVLLMDNLFDSLNASSLFMSNGKKYRAAVKRNSAHHELWQKALRILKSVKFILKSNGSRSVKSVPTVNNFINTIEGFKSLWQLLSGKYYFDAMLTRNFNQDPLENFFGSIRSLGARNVSPNCMGFEGAFKTLLLNNLSSDHSLNSNCEDDTSCCLQSLSFMIKEKSKCNNAPSQSQSIVIDQPLRVVENETNMSSSGADQRTYVCGWALTKCLQKVVKGCKQCKAKLLGNSKNEKYRYLQGKEFEKDKTWLCYPSDCLVACFTDIQNTTIAFLNSDCYKKKIRERIVVFVDLFVDFSFIDCRIHQEKLKKIFLETTINIIIYSWCRSVNRILEGKLNYDGDDIVKKAALEYYNKHKTIKKKQ